MWTVTSLWKHPVKSMQGHQADHVEIDDRGVVGDRRWAIRDVATGNVLTGRRVPELLLGVGGDGRVTLPTGEVTDDDAALSAWLGRPVELIGVAEGVRSTYEVPLDPLDGEQDWVSWQGPPASFVDSTKTSVSMIGSASMRTWDPRRFRMNVVLDADGEPADAEVALVGRRVRVGTVEFDVVKRVDRCVMVTRPQPGLERDLGVLSAINRDHTGNLGIGALVVTPGIVRLGDRVEILD